MSGPRASLPRRARPAWLAALALAALVGGSAAAHAQDPPAAPRDSTSALDRFLRSLADSTDRAYGASAAPIDTSGLDSVLAAVLGGPHGRPARRRLPVSFAPSFDFNRVDGPVYGVSARLGSEHGWGALAGRIAWAAGPDLGLGGAELRKAWGGRRAPVTWTARIAAGRATEPLDADRRSSALATARAFLGGADRNDYLRRDGVRVALQRESPVLRVGLAWRDQLESPRVTTATWNLFHEAPVRIDNPPAAPRRVRELATEATWRVPRLPLWLEGDWRVSSPSLGSGADYTRTRLAAASDVPLGRVATVVAQATYGRLVGELLPQDANTFGASRQLRSLGGTVYASGRAFGRVEVIESPDLLAWMPRDGGPPLELQMGVFAASGAPFGDDAFGGASYAGRAWPGRADWRSEAGVSFLYRPGLPDPGTYLRFDLAHRVGPGPRAWTLAFSISTPFELLRPIVR